MKNKLSWLTSGLLLIACVYLFFALFESYPAQVDTGWNEEARRNPYLAAQQFLQRQGIDNGLLDSLPQGEQLDDIETLYIEDSRDVLSAQQVSTLMDWVNHGGYLIVVAHETDDDAGDPLLAEFDISVEPTECECKKYIDPADNTESEGGTINTKSPKEKVTSKNHSDNKTAEEPAEKTETKRPFSQWLQRYNEISRETNSQDKAPFKQIDPANLSSLRFGDTEETLQVYFPPYWTLSHPFIEQEDGEEYSGAEPLYWAGSDWGVHFVQFQKGEGFITVMSDASIWHSDNIDELDSAYLLSVLSGGNFVFLVGHHMPSLFTLIWQQAKEIIIAFAVWLTLWLLYRGHRFLPPRELSTSIRRSISEHIDAVAHFLWQRRATGKLLESLREEIQQRAQLIIYGYSNLNLSQRIQAIATHSHLSEQAVNTALSAESVRGEEQFTEIIQSLQKIRSTL